MAAPSAPCRPRLEVYVALKPGVTPGPDIEARVINAIETEIGKIARPKNVWIVSDMPKTRSGKIMRRVIASISNFTDVGDVTTLANPEIVEDIRQQVQREKLNRGEAPRELSPQEEAVSRVRISGRAVFRGRIVKRVARRGAWFHTLGLGTGGSP